MTDDTTSESPDRSTPRTALDREADRLYHQGRLRLFDTIDGALLLGHIRYTGDNPEVVILGEIEGGPEGMTRHFAPERPARSIRDTFFLGGMPPNDWGWLSWADKVPNAVKGLSISHALRVKIATAANAANTLIDLSGLLGQLTKEIDAEIQDIANANTPTGDDNADLLAALLDQVTGPLDERLHHIAAHIPIFAGHAVIKHDRPSDLDGTLVDDSLVRQT